MLQQIIFEEITGRDGNIGLVTLNRPEALNALSHEMTVKLHQQLLYWENDSRIKGVIIQAVKGRAFCAGGDIRAIYEKNKTRDSSLIDFFRDEYRLNHYIFHYPKPYIALMNGVTMGGGVGISIHGSHRVGTENLILAMPETGIGFFPDIGGSYFLSRLPHHVGIYLGLTGAQLDVSDCLAVRLIDHKILQEHLPFAIKALAETSFERQGKKTVTRILKQFEAPSVPSSLKPYFPVINETFAQKQLENIFSGLQMMNSDWCLQTINNLKIKSPTSLKITLQQLHQGLGQDFKQCLQMEYYLAGHFLQGHDFFEGIRAFIITKDRLPNWQPDKLSDINQSDIDKYFTPLPGTEAQLLFA